ncbi:MAG: FecR family protein [Devosia sp.]
MSASPTRLAAHLSRRLLLASTPAAMLALAVRPASAAIPIGRAVSVEGGADVQRGAEHTPLTADVELMLDDLVITREDGFAQLLLTPDTLINLGSGAQLLIDQYIANQGGVLQLGGGALVFDRPDGARDEDVTIRTAFAMIGVRGTRFFAGPSKGAFGVFVERGEVSVLAADVKRILRAGDGVDIAAPGEPPSEIKPWGQPRIDAAYASVGL